MVMKQNSSRKSIRKFILLWMSGLVFTFFIIAAALILSTNRVHSMMSKVFFDSWNLEAARRLEATVLREHRENLLWQATHDDRHRLRGNKEMENADRIIRELYEKWMSAEDKPLFNKVEKRFKELRITEMADTPAKPEKISFLTDSLMQAVEDFGELNRKQLVKTVEAYSKLNVVVDRWSLIIIIFAALAVAVGSLVLIDRIIQPTLGLTSTAMRFGKGDFKARAKIYRNDEFGMLCNTFNCMADDIYNLQRERLNFVATVAHDLKNPLMVIGGASRLLKKKVSASDEHSKWLDCIINQVEYVDNLLHDLMDSIQIETGNLSLRMEEFELGHLVRSIQQVQDELIATHSIFFEGESECRIKGDAKRIERVITNLVSNAIKYSPENSSVLLRVKKSDSGAVVTIKDEGVGIAQDEIPNLFQPFKRLSKTQGMARGTGLGLFSAKKIVEDHGGTINIFSEAGSGTTVEIILPLAPDR